MCAECINPYYILPVGMENNNAIRVDVRLYNVRTGITFLPILTFEAIDLACQGIQFLRQPLTLIRVTPCLIGPAWAIQKTDIMPDCRQGLCEILSELWTEISPTGAYWNPTRLESDTRLPAPDQ
jgi:hypothetical protein